MTGLEPGALRHAVAILKEGGIIAYATEGCYGLGCDPHRYEAVLRLLRIKQRSRAKGLILIAANTAQLDHYVDKFPRKALSTWPGPFTWLLDYTAKVPPWIRGTHTTLAVRVTAHSQAAKLCRAAGMALVSTSANRAGEKPARSYRETLRRLGDAVDFVLPGRVGELKHPTPISDAATGHIIRPTDPHRA